MDDLTVDPCEGWRILLHERCKPDPWCKLYRKHWIGFGPRVMCRVGIGFEVLANQKNIPIWLIFEVTGLRCGVVIKLGRKKHGQGSLQVKLLSYHHLSRTRHQVLLNLGSKTFRSPSPKQTNSLYIIFKF